MLGVRGKERDIHSSSTGDFLIRKTIRYDTEMADTRCYAMVKTSIKKKSHTKNEL
jgi:hypothetical protein